MKFRQSFASAKHKKPHSINDEEWFVELDNQGKLAQRAELKKNRKLGNL